MAPDFPPAEDLLQLERRLFVGGPVLVIRWQGSPPHRVDYISPNVRRILGYDPEDLVSGRILFDSLLAEPERGRVQREAAALRSQGAPPFEQEYQLRHANGEYRWFQDFCVSAGEGPSSPILGYLLDITERKTQERELQQAHQLLAQAEKLESLGSLAGGVAHDMNNVLAAIQAVTQTLALTRAGDGELLKALGTIQKAAERGGKLVGGLTRFAGKQGRDPESLERLERPAGPESLRILLVDDDELIRSSVPILLEFLGHQVTVASGGQEALDLLAGGAQIDQVILDLNMPGLNGLETLAELRRTRRHLPVLVATGYLDDATAVLLKQDPRASSMTKPFNAEEISRKLIELGRRS